MTVLQTTQTVGGSMTDEQKKTLHELLICCLSWQPQVRVMGNVRAGDAADALRALLSASEASAEPLVVWRAIAEEAEIVVYRSGKRLLLTEEMCMRLGTAIENTYAPRPDDYATLHLTPEQAAKEAK